MRARLKSALNRMRLLGTAKLIKRVVGRTATLVTAPVRAAANPLVGHGTYPHFFLKSLSRALTPRTINDRWIRNMLFDRRSHLTRTVDKATARDYVANIVGTRYLTTLYQLVGDPHDIEWDRLPCEFVLKVTHGAGGVAVVTASADATAEIPEPAGWGRYAVHPESLDRDRLVATCNEWLQLRHGWGRGQSHEWVYKGITPRILIEELLKGPTGPVPPDYKLWVFHGQVHMIQVDSDRLTEHRQGFYTPQWAPIPVVFVGPPPDQPHPRPEHLAELIQVAERLGADSDFVRVDLYDTGDRVVFGELSYQPMAARQEFYPKEYGVELERVWRRTRRSRRSKRKTAH